MSGPLWFEDFIPGEKAELGSHTFTRESIVAFAETYDPQAFHLDDHAARRSSFGAMIASGWHTAAAFMQCWSAYHAAQRESAGASGKPLPPPGPSPGFESLQWLKPVRVDDTLTYFSEVRTKRPLASRPAWGLVTFHNTGVNQRGETVFSFTGKLLIAIKS